MWGVDWGKAGDQSCVSIIKRLPGGGIEVLATEYGPPASKPLTGILSIAYSGGRVVTCSFKTEAEAKAFEQYAIEVAHQIGVNK